MSVASVGTDTGGSIRIPSAACGVVGLKPEWNEVSSDGIVPLSRQLDHVGPITRSVEDAAIMFDILRGAAPAPLETTALWGKRFGLLGGYFLERLDEHVEAGVLAAVDRLRSAGASVSTVSIPHAASIAPVYLHLVLADAAAYHARSLHERPAAYTQNVRLRLEMGRYVLAEDYVRALRGKDIVRAEIDRALVDVDALVLPALAIPAPPLGAASVPVKGGQEPVRNAMLRCTQPFNVSGHPAISLPCGTTPSGLPIGLQVAGRRGATTALLRIARAVETALTAA
jgi:aspartyl-tRNA(Asn)/glutamyl-tRNA(Gln) amidotransferase subunit A